MKIVGDVGVAHGGFSDQEQSLKRSAEKWIMRKKKQPCKYLGKECARNFDKNPVGPIQGSWKLNGTEFPNINSGDQRHSSFNILNRNNCGLVNLGKLPVSRESRINLGVWKSTSRNEKCTSSREGTCQDDCREPGLDVSHIKSPDAHFLWGLFSGHFGCRCKL